MMDSMVSSSTEQLIGEGLKYLPHPALGHIPICVLHIQDDSCAGQHIDVLTPATVFLNTNQERPADQQALRWGGAGNNAAATTTTTKTSSLGRAPRRRSSTITPMAPLEEDDADWSPVSIPLRTLALKPPNSNNNSNGDGLPTPARRRISDIIVAAEPCSGNDATPMPAKRRISAQNHDLSLPNNKQGQEVLIMPQRKISSLDDSEPEYSTRTTTTTSSIRIMGSRKEIPARSLPRPGFDKL
jgi:hypothetical protein